MAGILLAAAIPLGRPPPPPLIIPLGGPFPGTDRGDFEHVLQHVIWLTTSAQRDLILVNAGARTVDDLLLLDEESLTSVLTNNTNQMVRMRLKALKQGLEN